MLHIVVCESKVRLLNMSLVRVTLSKPKALKPRMTE